MKMLFAALIVVMAVGCGGGDDADEPDATATRAVELTAVATLQSASQQATETAAPSATTSRASSPTRDAAVTATVAPTETPSPTATVAPTETPTIEPTATQAPVGDLTTMLPTLDDMPAGFAMTEDIVLDAPALAASQPDPNAGLDKLNELDFQQAVSRTFQIPSPGLNDAMSRMVTMQTTVYEFGSPEQADEYIAFNRGIIEATEGAEMQQVSADEIGDNIVALQGTLKTNDTTAIVAMMYVRQGPILFRFQGISLGYNSMPDVTEIATTVVDRAS